jgi:hypothetical protein
MSSYGIPDISAAAAVQVTASTAVKEAPPGAADLKSAINSTSKGLDAQAAAKAADISTKKDAMVAAYQQKTESSTNENKNAALIARNAFIDAGGSPDQVPGGSTQSEITGDTARALKHVPSNTDVKEEARAEGEAARKSNMEG